MTETNKQSMKWKKHEIEEQIGYDQYKNSQSWAGNFNFVIGADVQLGYIWPHRERDAKDWKIEMEKAICAVDKINNLTPRPQFVVICGDLINELSDDATEIKELQINDFQQIFSKLHPSISLVCVCGNHDVGNIPNEDSINKYREHFGQDYFSFWCGGVLFLVMNTQYYKNRDNVKKHAEEQDQWLTEKLNDNKGQRIIVFQHIPWFVENVDEKTQYFNINENFRKNMLEKMHAAGVSHVFCGHYHRNCIKFYKNIEIVTTNAIGAPMGPMEPSGLRIVQIYENNIIHAYYPLEKMPRSIIN